MATHSASEPKTRAEMHARKKLADERQAAAARRLAEGHRDPAPEPVRTAPAIELPAETVQPAPAEPFDPKTATARQIIAHVAAQWDLTVSDLLSESRTGMIAAARREAMGEVYKAKPHLSYPQIGRLFGGRDHTTVLHALRELGLVEARGGRIADVNEVDDGGMRPVRPLDIDDARPASIDGGAPRFRDVDPTTLRIDARYQRDLSAQSLALIRRIVEGWSWRAFKPPIVVEAGAELHVIDGQHTSIAAASHPDISTIPVMIVEAARQEERADAFVRHNRDRVRMSGQQIYHALVVAGDPEAVAIAEACREAGARVLRSKVQAARYRPGDTMAVEALSSIMKRRGPDGMRRVLSACVRARLTPIRAHEMQAVEALLFDPDHAGEFDEASIAAVFLGLGPNAERQAGVFSAQHRVPRGRGLAITLARAPKRLRKLQEAGAL